MEQLYRGDTFQFLFSAINDETDEVYTFKENDVLKFGIKKSINDKDYIIFTEKKLENEIQEIPFEFTHTETMNLPLGILILEVELTSSKKVHTLLQEQIKIVGDVINE